MKSGLNDFTVLATDITGGAVDGLVSGWSVEGEVANTTITTIDSISGALSENGYYIASIDLPAGQGYVAIKNSNSGVFITPQYFQLDVDTADNDDIYSVIQQQTVSPVPYDYSTRFGEYTISIKESDDFYELMNVPLRYLPLTGWTSFTVQAYPESALNSALIPAISGGTYSCTVVSDTLGTVQIGISNEVFTGLIPEGVASTVIYADVQAYDTNNKRRTLITIKFNVIREFNKNT